MSDLGTVAMRDAFNAAAKGQAVCVQATMNYRDGGRSELWKFQLSTGKTIQVELAAMEHQSAMEAKFKAALNA